MKNPFTVLSDYISRKKSEAHTRHVKELSLRLQSEIQVMEFNSEFYLSYNGVPLVNVENLPTPKKAAAIARQTAFNYMKDRIGS